jgi:branched-chain amino acid aminotransferase
VIIIISYQRDRFVTTEELCFPFVGDVGGTIRGYRIFTACRTCGEKIFRIEDHLDRLYYSAASIYMKPPMERDSLRTVLYELIQENRKAGFKDDLLIDIIFSGGLEDNTMAQSGRNAYLYVAVRELIAPPSEFYEKGVALATCPYMRMYPDVKLLNYMGAIMAHQTVVPRNNAYDVIFIYPPDGITILEGSTFTVFFVNAEGTVVTPPLDGKILDSVTRRVVLQVLQQSGKIRLKEDRVHLNELDSYPEAFMASTTRNVLPVVRIDDRIIGSGQPGPVTREIMHLVEHYVAAFSQEK